jgi:hypothetical protein
VGRPARARHRPGPAIDGFPLAHAARFEDPAMHAPDGFSWRGPTLSAQSALWDPWTIVVSFSGRHLVEDLNAGLLELWDPWTIVVSFAGRHLVEDLNAGLLEAVTFDSRDAVGVLQLGGDGRLVQADATLEGLEVLAEPFGRIASALLRVSLTPD